ncbi:MAG TPA: phosphatase PAP2 family protein [Mycobacteriales bacterium]|nr:phosphatase PAP2 family protein [Mycobacteriales bacterium]
MRRRVGAADRALFRRVAGMSSRPLDAVLPPLTRAADHSVLWMAVSAGLVLSGRPELRRAAAYGLGSVAVASLLANQVGKRLLPRVRPLLDSVPVARRAHRTPGSHSFPSGHAASAAAFAVGASAEAPVLAVPLGVAAAAVGFSRVYTGVHYPADVLAGAALGATVAVTIRPVGGWAARRQAGRAAAR